MSAALPLRVFPPLFNRYRAAQSFGNHVDNAIRQVPGTPHRIRTDLSATLFFADPDEYDGGELLVEDTYGVHSVKLPAGHMVLYPSTSLHHVQPVTRGARVASFFWLQSMIRDDGAADAAVRPGHGDPAARPRRAESSVGRAAHRRLPQPAAAVGGDVGPRDRIRKDEPPKLTGQGLKKKRARMAYATRALSRSPISRICVICVICGCIRLRIPA